MTWNEAFFSCKHHSFTFFNQWDGGFVSHLKFSRGKISNSLDAKMIIIFEIISTPDKSVAMATLRSLQNRILGSDVTSTWRHRVYIVRAHLLPTAELLFHYSRNGNANAIKVLQLAIDAHALRNSMFMSCWCYVGFWNPIL